jgi:hypothetical protein
MTGSVLLFAQLPINPPIGLTNSLEVAFEVIARRLVEPRFWTVAPRLTSLDRPSGRFGSSNVHGVLR